MATIRFIREGIDVQCQAGENLRDLVIKEKLSKKWQLSDLSVRI